MDFSLITFIAAMAMICAEVAKTDFGFNVLHVMLNEDGEYEYRTSFTFTN